MQIGAINLQNFKAREYNNDNEYANPCDCEECQAHEAINQNTVGFDQFVSDVNKAKSDVNPLTCILGSLAAVAAFKTGSKAVGYVRSGAAKLAEEVSKGCVKGFSKIKKSTDVSKAFEGIHKFFLKFTNENDIKVADAKIQDKVKDVVTSIFGKVNKEGALKGDAFVETLNKNGIYLNARSLFDNALAAFGALAVADGVGDVAEDTLDRKKIKDSAFANFRMYEKMANEVLDSVS